MSTTSLNAILIDDEPYNLQHLQMALERFFPHVHVAGTANSVAAAEELLAQHTPDVVFLDIQMPEVNGLEFLAKNENRPYEVVLVTAYSQYGIEAIKAGAIDYLLKPIDRQELGKAIEKVQQRKEEKLVLNPGVNPDRISIPHSKGITVVSTSEITRIEADNNYSNITFSNGNTLMVAKSIKEFENQLVAKNFIRIHKSSLINLDYLDRYTNTDGCSVVMRDGTELLVSRRKQADFLKRLKAYSHLMR